jgi:hypothetical protein
MNGINELLLLTGFACWDKTMNRFLSSDEYAWTTDNPPKFVKLPTKRLIIKYLELIGIY